MRLRFLEHRLGIHWPDASGRLIGKSVRMDRSKAGNTQRWQRENGASPWNDRVQRCNILVSVQTGCGCAQGKISMRFQCICCDESLQFQRVSFTVKSGEVVALVGPSGGGKSSCIGLLEHFYEPKTGVVALDGIPVTRYDHRFFHQKVSPSVS